MIFAVGAFRVDEELSVAAEKASGDAQPREAGVIEVAEDRLFGGDFHRPVVVGAVPQVELRLVALGAGMSADVGSVPHGVGRKRGVPVVGGRGDGGDGERGEDRVSKGPRHRCLLLNRIPKHKSRGYLQFDRRRGSWQPVCWLLARAFYPFSWPMPLRDRSGVAATANGRMLGRNRSAMEICKVL